jgi:hypothetical protein
MQESGTGLLGIITIVLCTLKFFGLIDISWFWATAFFWIPVCIGLAISLTLLIFR